MPERGSTSHGECVAGVGMAQAHYISESDAQILRQMAADYRRRVGNTTGRGRRDGIEDEESNAPEVYIARTPAGGLPGLDRGPTGTGSVITDDSPGEAECAIYRIVDGGGFPLLEPVDGLEKLVYNLTEAAIPEHKWISVIRDKFGSWLLLRAAVGLTQNWVGLRDVDCDPGSDALIGIWDELVFEDGLITEINLDVPPP